MVVAQLDLVGIAINVRHNVTIINRRSPFGFSRASPFSEPDLSHVGQVDGVSALPLDGVVGLLPLAVLFSLRMTNFKPDQTLSTAQTLMSTRPIGKATSRMVSSVMSVGTLEDLFGQETQITPSCFRFFREARSASVNSVLLAEKM